MKLRLSTVIGAGLAAAALAAAALYATRQAPQATPASLATAQVTRGDIEDTVAALGSIQPLEFVDVGTQVSGQLKRLRVKIGDNVSKGAVLAEIDAAVLAAKLESGQATLRSLAAQIDEKQVQFEQTQRQRERQAQLFAQGMVSREAQDAALTNQQMASAQVAALKAQRAQLAAALRVDQSNLDFARILAPMSGTVVSLNAREGQTLNASQAAPVLLRLANLDTMTVVTQVSEADVVRLEPGTTAHFNTLGRPDRRWAGKVRQILPTPETVNNVVLYNVLFEVDNTDRQLMAQMSAQVSFVLAQAKDALLVPVAALMAKAPKTAAAENAPLDAAMVADDLPAPDRSNRPGAAKPARAAQAEAGPAQPHKAKSYRVKVLKDGVVQERKVTVGIVNRLTAQVLSGLEEGEQVVLASGPDTRRDSKPKDGTRKAPKS